MPVDIAFLQYCPNLRCICRANRIFAEYCKKHFESSRGLTNDFADFKGDFLQKDGSGNSYYSVKDIEIGTSSQYVIMRANGAYTYAAVFEPKDDNDKTPILAFTAFTGGIIAVRQNTDINVIQDAAGSQGSTLKYFLMAKDIKIASFTFDTGTKSGTLLVAIQQ